MGRLNSLSDWLKWQENLHNKEIDLGLERVKKVYKKLFPNGVPFKVITVSGTNGKGSTIRFIEAIYQTAGVQVGSFTSPHLHRYNERFLVCQTEASDEEICQSFAKIDNARGQVSLTYFEFSALAALLIFTQKKVAVAVLEVGLGGRLDAVNMVDADVSLITNIALDHTDYLGATTELIGREKAGIMRQNKPCIYGAKMMPKSVQKYADEVGARLLVAEQIGDIELGLQGDFQNQNAALAKAGISQLNEFFPTSNQQIMTALKNAKLAGRFEVRIVNNKTVILDVAHNPAAVEALAKNLTKNRTNGNTVAIFGVMQDKDIEAIIGSISAVIERWILVDLGVKRAASPSFIMQKLATEKVVIIADMPAAIRLALADNNTNRVVIFGSFLTVAAALNFL